MPVIVLDDGLIRLVCLDIVQIYGKQVKFMAIKFTTDHVYLISENDVLTGSSKIWTEIPKASLFQEYDFEGCGSENHLYLRTPCDNLSDVLKGSVHGVKLLRIRLRGRDKNSKPCLQFEYDQVGPVAILNGLIITKIHFSGSSIF